MDWRSIKFDWNRARAFLVTAEEGSLSAAARALGMTQPTLGRQVSALEKELGVALFERVGLGLILTPSGLDLVEHVRAMRDAASRVSLTASGQSQSIEGNVCISCSEYYAVYKLPAIVKKLRKLEPKITIEIIATSTTSDLRRREADIAIRNFRPTQPELIAKKIKDVYARLYATPEYLNEIGELKKPEDLSRADFISFDEIDGLITGLNAMGLTLTKKNFPLQTEHFITHWELAKQGLGIGIMPEELGEKETAIVQALPTLAPIEFPIWLTAHRELNTSRRIRMVFDLLAKELAE
jgi:DNA-binding transcriptional LysR family regulator